MVKKPQFHMGDKVLASVQAHPGHNTDAYLPGIITRHLGMMDIYDGRVRQSKVNFPVVQHYYQIELEEGGSVNQVEGRMTKDPQDLSQHR